MQITEYTILQISTDFITLVILKVDICNPLHTSPAKQIVYIWTNPIQVSHKHTALKHIILKNTSLKNLFMPRFNED